jgi:hypothetical protein
VGHEIRFSEKRIFQREVTKSEFELSTANFPNIYRKLSGFRLENSQDLY